MNLSDRFRQHFEKVHNSAQTAMQNRKADFKKERKAKKDDLAYARRNIDFNNISPYVTPSTTPHCPKITVKKPDGSKRLEMLAKWKEEKAKKKLEEKAKQKPLFKVYHVSPEKNKLDVMSKMLKQHEILTASLRNVKFAPENHKFRAPVGVKPMDFAFVRCNIEKSSKLNTPSTTPGTSRLAPKPTEAAKRTLNLVKRPPSSIKTTRQSTTKNITPSTRATRAPPKNTITPVSSQLRNKITSSVDKSRTSSTTKISVKNPPSAKPTTASNAKVKTPSLANLNKNKATPVSSKVPKVATFTPKRILRSKLTDKVDGKDVNNKSVAVEKAKNTKVSKKINTTDSHLKNSKKAEDNNNKSEPVERVKINKVSKKINTTEIHLKNNSKNAEHDDGEDNNNKSELLETLKNSRSSEKISKNESDLKNSKGANPVDGEDNNNKSEPVERVKINKVSTKTNRSESDLNNSKEPESINKNIVKVEKVQKVSQTQKLCLTKSLLNRSKGVGATPKASVDQESNNNGSEELPKIQSPTYISPFVTISRGKRSARDEFSMRRSCNLNSSINADTPKKTGIFSQYTTPNAGANYFMVKLDREIEKIKANYEKLEEWRQHPDLPEEAHCSIDVTIGQSKLLIKEKFEQFRGLIMQVKTKKYEENVVTCEDLHGFWDMIYMQVIDLEKRYANLEKMKENNWLEMLPTKSPVKPKKAPARKKNPKKPAATSRLKDMIKAAREKQKAGITDKDNEEDKMFDGGCYKVMTPVKDTPQVTASSGSKRNSSRVSVLSEPNKRISSPGLTMMKVSQSIKHNNGLTPAKSILKPMGCISTGKKSVAFVSPSRNMKQSVLFNEAVKNSGKVSIRRSLGFGCETPPKSPVDKNCSLSESEKENTPLRRSARLAK